MYSSGLSEYRRFPISICVSRARNCKGKEKPRDSDREARMALMTAEPLEVQPL